MSLTYADVVQQAKDACAGPDYAPLVGEFHPCNWWVDVYEAIGDAQTLEYGFGAEPGMLLDTVPLFHAVLGAVNDLLCYLPVDRPGPNPAALADRVARILRHKAWKAANQNASKPKRSETAQTVNGDTTER